MRVAVAIWLIALRGGAALANDAAEQAEKLVRHGIELRRQRDDEAAAREFQAAYKLFPSPRTAAQLGLAKQALGLWEDAERYVAEALRAATDPWVAKNRGVLDDALGTIQKHLGRIEVIGDPEGADVSVNGRRIGKLPLAEPVRVSAGQVDIDVRARGYSPAQRTVTLVGGQYQRVVFHLVQAAPAIADATRVEAGKTEPPQVSAPPPPTAEGGSPSAPAATVTQHASDGAEAGPSNTRIALKWTAAGLAVGGLVAGTLGTVLHSNNVDRFNNHPCRNNQGAGVSLDGTPDPACQSLLDSFRTDRTIAIVGFVAAGALTGAWLALAMTEPSGPAGSSQQAARPLCAPALTGLGFSCAAHF